MVLKRSIFQLLSMYTHFWLSNYLTQVSRLSSYTVEKIERKMLFHYQAPDIKYFLIWELFVTKVSRMDWTGQGYECNQYGEEEEDYEEGGKYTI